MITIDELTTFALSLPDVVQLPHFELSSFRIRGKIFVTIDPARNRACVMLDPVDQSVFIHDDVSIMYPVPNSWGTKGATYVDLHRVRKSVIKDAVRRAYSSKSQSAKSKRKPSR